MLAALQSKQLALELNLPSTPGAVGPGLDSFALASILNELAAVDHRVVLVLDDYHHIQHAGVHEAVAHLVAQLPKRHRIVIATRYDPPIPVARWRVAGEVTEFRVADLAFDSAEIAAAIEAVSGRVLSGELLERLRARTEGWPAAVHLAALSLRGSADVADFIYRFAGDHRSVADYLAEEVINQVPEDLRVFLMKCSVLDRLDADLCRVVTGRGDAGNQLRRAEQLNLFLVPLDERRNAYRFHRLFADWLLHQLRLESPEQPSALHRRAAQWYSRHRRPAEAIHHALAGGDISMAKRSILEHGEAMTAEGRVVTLARWLAALPDEVVTADPVLSIAAAAGYATGGDPDTAASFLDAAERAYRSGVPVAVALDVDVEIAALRATISLVRRDLVAAVELARRAAALEIDPTKDRYGVAHSILATALFWAGEPSEARRAADAIWADISSGYIRMTVAGILAVACFESGEIDRAERVGRHAVDLAARTHVGPSPEMALSHLGLGAALAARGELDAAVIHLETGIDLAKWWQVPSPIAYGRLLLGAVRVTQGSPDEAEELLRLAAPVVDTAQTEGQLARSRKRLEVALRQSAGRGLAGVSAELTDRERDVLRLLPSPLNQREIGRELYLSRNTVKTHTQSLYRKLGVSSRREAVARAQELHLL
jgi:LuxR family maltose regulon positive regulatory protein